MIPQEDQDPQTDSLRTNYEPLRALSAAQFLHGMQLKMLFKATGETRLCRTYRDRSYVLLFHEGD